MRTTPHPLRLALFWCALILLPPEQLLRAEPRDPAASQVQILTDTLLQSMQAGPAEPMTVRYHRLEPVISQVIDLPAMTRLAVGLQWNTFSPEQQSALIAAFGRFTVANYAHNFRDFSGQKFEIGDVISRGEDKIVRGRILPAHDTPVNLLYRMREVNGAWKVIDVDSDGISELALRRDQFGAAIAAGGPPTLIAYLHKASDELMK
jgi:phospholipid transport system substrate-binding protein